MGVLRDFMSGDNSIRDRATEWRAEQQSKGAQIGTVPGINIQRQRELDYFKANPGSFTSAMRGGGNNTLLRAQNSKMMMDAMRRQYTPEGIKELLPMQESAQENAEREYQDARIKYWTAQNGTTYSPEEVEQYRVKYEAAKAKVDNAKADAVGLGQRYFELDSKQQLDEISDDQRLHGIYQAARQAEADMQKLQNILHYRNDPTSNNAETAPQDIAYLQRKYGLDKNFTEDQLYDYLVRIVTNAENTLKEAGYKYDSLAYYEDSMARNAESEKLSEEMKAYAKEKPGAATAYSVFASPLRAGEGLRVLLRGQGSTDDLDNYMPVYANDMPFTQSVSDIRDTVMNEHINSGVGRAAYQLGTSVADSVMGSIMSGGVSAIPSLILASGSASDATKDAIERGATRDQAFLMGSAVGAAEFIFEKIGFDELFSHANGRGLKAFLGDTLKQFGTEGVGEGLTEIANIISDATIMQDKSNTQELIRRLRENGATQAEAEKRAFLENVKQVASAALMGGISGAAMNVAYAPFNRNADSDLLDGLVPQAKQNASPADMAMDEADGIRVGRATVLKNPYDGDVPSYRKPANVDRPVVPSESVETAKREIEKAEADGALHGKSYRNFLTDVYEALFVKNGGARGVSVDGLTMDGKPYVVTINKSAIGKIVSDPNMSAEKLAVLDIIDEIVKKGEYVGSNRYVPKGSRAKHTVRFDLFETPIVIGGNEYIVTFDVEVFPNTNNYRTHKVINEMDLVMISRADTGSDQPQGSPRQDPSDNTLSHPAQPVNGNNLQNNQENDLSFLLDNESERFDNNVEQGEQIPPSVGATDYDRNSWSTFQNEAEGGYHPERPDAVRPTDVPLRDRSGNTISRAADTFMGAQMVPDRGVPDIEQAIVREEMSVERISDQDSLDRAQAYVDAAGYNDAFNHTIGALDTNGASTKDTIVRGFELVRRAYQMNTTEGDAQAMDMLLALQRKITDTAQALQCVAMMRRITPEGRLMGLQRRVDRINESNGGASQDTQDVALNRLREQYETALNLLSNIHEAFNNAERDHGRPYSEWMQEVGRVLANRVSPQQRPQRPSTLSQTVRRDLEKAAKVYFDRARPQNRYTAVQALENFINNADQYQEAWREARNSLAERYADNPERLAELNNFINNDLSLYSFRAESRREVARALRQLGVRDADLVRMNRRDRGRVFQQMLDLVYESNRRSADIENFLSEMFDEHVDAIRSGRDHGLGTEEWMLEVGRQLANALEPKARTQGTKTVSQQVRQDLFSIAKARGYAQRQQGGTRRTRTDVLRDFLSNRDSYTEAWSEAKRSMAETNRDEFSHHPFMDSNLDFLGGDFDFVVDRAIEETIVALEQKLTARNIDIRSYLGDRARIVNDIASSLVANTGADGNDATLIRNAVERYVTEHTKGEGEAIVNRDIKAALKDIGTDIATIIRTNNVDKAFVASQISDLLVSKYGISAEASADAANTIASKFGQMVAERSEKALESLFKERTPKDRKTLAKQFEELANMGAFANSQWEAQVTEKLFGGGVKVDPDLAAEFVNEQDPDEREKIFDEILIKIGEQMPTTFREVFDNIRYTNMLIGPSTHGKNITGNITQTGLKMSKDLVKAGLESIVNKVTDGKFGRTTTVLNLSNSEDKAKFDAAMADAIQQKEVLQNGGKYNPEAGKIREGRTIIKLNDPQTSFGKKVDSALRAYDKVSKFNSKLLDVEDQWFSQRNYALSLAQYMKANNMTEITDEAREYAAKEAQKTTLHDDNAFSEWARKLTTVYDTDKAFAKFAKGFLAKGVVPFARTNANALVRSIEYSPLGFAKTTITALSNNEITPSQVLDDISANLVGTVLWGLGALLAKSGALRFRGIGDEKERREQRRRGEKDFSIWNFPIEWLSNPSIQLMAGAAIYEHFATKKLEGGEGIDFDSFLQGLEGILEPMFQQSMFEGIQNVLTTSRDQDKGAGSAVLEVGANIARSYLTSLITPTPIRRIAGALDTYSRETYVDKNKAEFGQELTQDILGDIPFASQTQKPRVDIYGDLVEGGVVRGDKWWQTMLDVPASLVSPFFTSKNKTTELDKEIDALYRDPEVNTDGLTLYMPYAAKSFEVGGEKVHLTADQHTKYETARNKGTYATREAIYNADLFDKIPKQAQAVAMSLAYDFANANAKSGLDIGIKPAEWVRDLDGASDEEIANAIIEKALTSNGVSGYGDEARASRYRNSIYDMRNWGESNDVLDRAMENATAYNDALARQGMGFDIESDWMLKLADLSEEEQADAFIAKAVQDEADEVKKDHKSEGWNRYDGLAWLYDEGIIGDDEAKLGMSNAMREVYDATNANGKKFEVSDMIDVYAAAARADSNNKEAQFDAALAYIDQQVKDGSWNDTKATELAGAMGQVLKIYIPKEQEPAEVWLKKYGAAGQQMIYNNMSDTQKEQYNWIKKAHGDLGITPYMFETAVTYKGKLKKKDGYSVQNQFRDYLNTVYGSNKMVKRVIWDAIYESRSPWG